MTSTMQESDVLTTDMPEALERRIRTLMDLVCRHDLKVATAESCTGGLLASLLTDIPGVSHGFEAGFVVYTNAAKEQLLGVPHDLLEEHGAVSPQAALAMADAALARCKADMALSITGYAGKSPEGEEGLVHFALASPGMPTRHAERRFGDVGRSTIRLASIEVAVDLLTMDAERLAREIA
jgi:nicotinamide-nucleotide amidase